MAAHRSILHRLTKKKNRKADLAVLLPTPYKRGARQHEPLHYHNQNFSMTAEEGPFSYTLNWTLDVW